MDCTLSTRWISSIPRHKKESLDRKHVECGICEVMVIPYEASDPHDKESYTRHDNTNVPKRPEIGGVEDRAGIPELNQLCALVSTLESPKLDGRQTVVGECCQPNVQQYLRRRDMVGLLLNQHNIVQSNEHSKEQQFEDLEVKRHP